VKPRLSLGKQLLHVVAKGWDAINYLHTPITEHLLGSL
jgi:hypothetical protein